MRNRKVRKVPDAERREELNGFRKERNAKALGAVISKLRNRMDYSLCQPTCTADDVLQLLVKPEDHEAVKRAIVIAAIKSYFLDDLGSVVNYPIPVAASSYIHGAYLPHLSFSVPDSDNIPFLPVKYEWLNPDLQLHARIKLDEWVTNKIEVEWKHQLICWLVSEFGKRNMNYEQACFYFSGLRYLCEQASIYVRKTLPENMPNITDDMRTACKLANQFIAQALILPPLPENEKSAPIVVIGSFDTLKYNMDVKERGGSTVATAPRGRRVREENRTRLNIEATGAMSMFELVVPQGSEIGYSQLQNWYTKDGREVTILHNGNTGRKFNVFWRPIGTDQWQNTMPGFDDMLSLRCFLEENGMIPQ